MEHVVIHSLSLSCSHPPSLYAHMTTPSTWSPSPSPVSRVPIIRALKKVQKQVLSVNRDNELAEMDIDQDTVSRMYGIVTSMKEHLSHVKDPKGMCASNHPWIIINLRDSSTR